MTTADPQAIDAVPPSNALGAVVRRRIDALRAGDVGSLPIILGLAGIVAFFYWKNENYLSAGNFTNLMTQMAGVTTIAIGVVFVLLLGEIDLSISYVAGIAGVVVAQLQIPDESWQVKGVVAIAIAASVTALIGLVQGSFVALVGIPSFVVTLAGLLFWQGVILYVVGDAGVIVIEDNTINNVANYFFSDTVGLLIAAGATALYVAATLAGVVSRRRHGIHTDNLVVVAAKLVFFVVVLFGAVIWANSERGFPLAMFLVIIFLIFWTWVAERTAFGRHVYAVGGNAEAAQAVGHQRRQDPHPRVHDLRPHGRPRRRHPRSAPQLGRPRCRRRHAAARRDLGSGDRRHEPLRGSRPRDQRPDGLARDRDGCERDRPARVLVGRQVHGHGPHPPGRGHARHRVAAPAGRCRAVVRTCLGIWALGPMVTRFVPGGYQPEHEGETTAAARAARGRRARRPDRRLRVPLPG